MCDFNEPVNYMPVTELVFNNVKYFACTNASTTTALTTMWMSEFFKAYEGDELWIPNLIWRENRPNMLTTEHISCNPSFRYFRNWCVFAPKDVTTSINSYNVQILDNMRNLDLEVPDEKMFDLTEDPEKIDLVFVPCRAKNNTTVLPLGFIYKGQNEDGSLILKPIMSKYSNIYEYFYIVENYPLDKFQDKLHETIFDIDYGSIEYEDNNLTDYELLSKLKFHCYAKHITVNKFDIYGFNPKTAKSNPVLD